MRLTELRSNPDKNKKISLLEQLLKYEGRKDLFVSFTSDVGHLSHLKANKAIRVDSDFFEVDYTYKGEKRRAKVQVNKGSGPKFLTPRVSKAEQQAIIRAADALVGRNRSGSKLGINPRSTYGTPLGIYVYPVDYVIESSRNRGQITAPFTGNDAWKYLWVVQATCAQESILDIQNCTMLQYEQAKQVLRDVWPEKTLESLDQFDQVAQNAAYSAKQQTPAGFLWNLTRMVAEEEVAGKATVRWSALMRLLGYNLAIDMGSGLIHENEPTQAVFFDNTALRPVEVLTADHQMNDAYEVLTSAVADGWDYEDGKTANTAKTAAEIAKLDASTIYRGILNLNSRPWWVRYAIPTIRASKTFYPLILAELLRQDNFMMVKELGGDVPRQALMQLVSESPHKLYGLREAGFTIDDDLIVAACRDASGVRDVVEWINGPNGRDYPITERLLARMLAKALPPTRRTEDPGSGLREPVERLLKAVNPSEKFLERMLRQFPALFMPLCAKRMTPRTLITLLRRFPNLSQFVLTLSREDLAELKASPEGEKVFRKIAFIDPGMQLYLVRHRPEIVIKMPHIGEAAQMYLLHNRPDLLHYIVSPSPLLIAELRKTDPVKAMQLASDRGRNHVPDDLALEALRAKPESARNFMAYNITKDVSDTVIRAAAELGVPIATFQPARIAQFPVDLMNIFLKNDPAFHYQLFKLDRDWTGLDMDALRERVKDSVFASHFVEFYFAATDRLPKGSDQLVVDSFFMHPRINFTYTNANSIGQHPEIMQKVVERALREGRDDVLLRLCRGTPLDFKSALMVIEAKRGEARRLVAILPEDRTKLVDYLASHDVDMLVQIPNLGPLPDEIELQWLATRGWDRIAELVDTYVSGNTMFSLLRAKMPVIIEALRHAPHAFESIKRFYALSRRDFVTAMGPEEGNAFFDWLLKALDEPAQTEP